jgi:hypothetical protein
LGARRTIAAILLAAAFVPGAAGCSTSCATALLEGQLVRRGDQLVVHTPDGQDEWVEWPWGWSVRDDHGTFVVTDLLGSVKAREGDAIRAGGGERVSSLFVVCGEFEARAG